MECNVGCDDFAVYYCFLTSLWTVYVMVHISEIWNHYFQPPFTHHRNFNDVKSRDSGIYCKVGGISSFLLPCFFRGVKIMSGTMFFWG